MKQMEKIVMFSLFFAWAYILVNKQLQRFLYTSGNVLIILDF